MIEECNNSYKSSNLAFINQRNLLISDGLWGLTNKRNKSEGRHEYSMMLPRILETIVDESKVITSDKARSTTMF